MNRFTNVSASLMQSGKLIDQSSLPILRGTLVELNSLKAPDVVLKFGSQHLWVWFGPVHRGGPSSSGKIAISGNPSWLAISQKIDPCGIGATRLSGRSDS